MSLRQASDGTWIANNSCWRCGTEHAIHLCGCEYSCQAHCPIEHPVTFRDLASEPKKKGKRVATTPHIETRTVRQRLNDMPEPTRTQLHHLVLELCTALDEERRELWKAEQALTKATTR